MRGYAYGLCLKCSKANSGEVKETASKPPYIRYCLKGLAMSSSSSTIRTEVINCTKDSNTVNNITIFCNKLLLPVIVAVH
ncbi:MAG: hypothetical protein M3M88_06910 [Thermoproteota archaeon]|nr:hypothetical protein [Thermoproteota archaeon]